MRFAGENDPWDGSGGASHSRRPPWLVILAVVAAIAAAAALYFAGSSRNTGTGEESVASPEPTTGLRGVTLYFSDRDGDGLVPEERELPERDDFESRVELVIRALIDGPGVGDALAVLPESTHLRRAFFDAKTSTLYADFDAALVRDHPGGSTAEWKTWTALVRTLRANFPEIRRLQLLVQGEPIDTLAGHFDASRPVELDTWQ